MSCVENLMHGYTLDFQTYPVWALGWTFSCKKFKALPDMTTIQGCLLYWCL